jgi:hypothetical protein
MYKENKSIFTFTEYDSGNTKYYIDGLKTKNNTF